MNKIKSLVIVFLLIANIVVNAIIAVGEINPKAGLSLNSLTNLAFATLEDDPPEDPKQWIRTAELYDVSCRWCYEYPGAGKLDSSCDCYETQYRCYEVDEGDPTCEEEFELSLKGNCTPIDGGMWGC